MSWDIYLQDGDGYVMEVPRHSDGGTYAAGGSTTAALNVTYNYTQFFDFGVLNGRRAADSIPELSETVDRLGTEQDQNYWRPTAGNTGYAANILLRWAREFPSATWQVR